MSLNSQIRLSFPVEVGEKDMGTIYCTLCTAVILPPLGSTSMKTSESSFWSFLWVPVEFVEKQPLRGYRPAQYLSPEVTSLYFVYKCLKATFSIYFFVTLLTDVYLLPLIWASTHISSPNRHHQFLDLASLFSITLAMQWVWKKKSWIWS